MDFAMMIPFDKWNHCNTGEKIREKKCEKSKPRMPKDKTDSKT